MGRAADRPVAARLGPPTTDAELAAVRTLFSEYAASLGFSLEYQGFATELAHLPGRYQPPGGALRLATVGGEPAGVVALRALSDGTAELKRLFVRPAFRGIRCGDGRTIGRALVEAIIAEARRLGHRRIRLDTIAPQMDAALRLYRALGFVEIPPYFDSPVPGTVFLELRL